MSDYRAEAELTGGSIDRVEQALQKVRRETLAECLAIVGKRGFNPALGDIHEEIQQLIDTEASDA